MDTLCFFQNTGRNMLKFLVNNYTGKAYKDTKNRGRHPYVGEKMTRLKLLNALNSNWKSTHKVLVDMGYENTKFNRQKLRFVYQAAQRHGLVEVIKGSNKSRTLPAMLRIAQHHVRSS